MAKTYDKQIADTKVMVDGLTGRGSELPTGITAEMVAEIDKILKATIALNSQQEKLKADLKAKTAEYDANLKLLNDKAATAKKYIKIAIPQENWKEFGIEDKK